MSGKAIDLSDVQGLIRSGYGKLPSALYLMLRITDVAAATRWLEALASDITRADEVRPREAVNIAFTANGLAALGVPEEDVSLFSREFNEGMVTPHRERKLGDVGSSAPVRWRWGGPWNERIDAVLMLYASDRGHLDALAGAHRARFSQACHECAALTTTRLAEHKEHFGFRDGIAQPNVEGFGTVGTVENTIATGEVLLGHRNQRGRVQPGPYPLATNGSYLVFRQLEQHVHRFWAFVSDAAKGLSVPRSTVPPAVLLASKMVGRWPSGAPLVRFPYEDPGVGASPEKRPEDSLNDNFGFNRLDPHGIRCPFGAHIRRTNPRDALEPGPRVSIRNSNLHRLLRRGRAYGPPLVPGMSLTDLIEAEDDGQSRGLHFLCFNADIAQQFEFVQQNWVNSPKFEGLFYAATDPITGVHDSIHPEYTDTFTVQAEPLRWRVTGVPQCVDVAGGAYLFMPGLRSLHLLATPLCPT